jgi:16S rRNA (guanine527-N7)-methyltransferase
LWESGDDRVAGAAAVPVPEGLTPAARALFGDRLGLAEAYAELLASDGVIRGLIGPREAPRIWDRHLLNCAAVAELIPSGVVVADVGSGAGLPGIVLALARPDLSVVLIEPLARRTAFLIEAVSTLGLDGQVELVRARAEDAAAEMPTGPTDIVTARAVAPLDRLAGWCLPLVVTGGRLLALKGASAAEEVAEYQDVVRRLGGGVPEIRMCGTGLIEPPTTVVEIVREREVPPRSSTSASRAGGHKSTSDGTRRGRSARRR